MRLKNSQRAFTLLEIMIAMTIFTTIVLGIYSSWMSILRGSKAGLNAAAAAQRSRIAVRAIEDALLTTQLFTQNGQYYSFLADTTDPELAWLSFTAQLPANFPGSGLFGDLKVRRVTFGVEADAEGKPQLVMTQAPYLLVTNSDVTAYPITLAKDVSLFVLEFWNEQLGDWTDEWIATNQIPKLMRVSLGVGQGTGSYSEPNDVTTRVIAIPSIAVTPDIQQPQRAVGAGGGRGNPRTSPEEGNPRGGGDGSPGRPPRSGGGNPRGGQGGVRPL